MKTWAYAVMTLKGLALQSKLIAGTTLTITKTVIGAGYVPPDTLKVQTSISDPRQTKYQLSGVSYPASGKCAVQLNLKNENVETGYTAMQIGFYANDPDEGEILYFIAQAESGAGTIIPSAAEMPGYSAEWTFYFQYSQADKVSVTVDPSNSVTQIMLEEALEKHNQDPEAHQAIQILLQQHNQDPGAHGGLLKLIGDLDIRVTRLELMYGTDVTGNPFTVTFETMDGVMATGVWNVEQKRMEF